MSIKEQPSWDGKTKGSLLGYKIFVFFISSLGVAPAYFLLKIVSFYYFIFTRDKKKELINFYETALKKENKEAKKLTRKNFYIFGQTLIDRIAFLLKKDKKFNHEFDGENYLREINKNKKGGILISAHLGNWEIAGNLLKDRISSKINVLMQDEEIENIKQYLKDKTGGARFNIIPVKNDLSHIIKINNALANNEFICMHADRFLPNTPTLNLNFMGNKALFPKGPFIVAEKFKAPVTFVFMVKTDKYKYKLTATPPIEEKLKAEDFAILFVKELEKRLNLHPEQWFNYYDFFNAGKTE